MEVVHPASVSQAPRPRERSRPSIYNAAHSSFFVLEQCDAVAAACEQQAPPTTQRRPPPPGGPPPPPPSPKCYFPLSATNNATVAGAPPPKRAQPAELPALFVSAPPTLRRLQRCAPVCAPAHAARLAAADVAELLVEAVLGLALHGRVDLAGGRVRAERAAEEQDVRLRAEREKQACVRETGIDVGAEEEEEEGRGWRKSVTEERWPTNKQLLSVADTHMASRAFPIDIT